SRDWSSDVCSSDLLQEFRANQARSAKARSLRRALQRQAAATSPLGVLMLIAAIRVMANGSALCRLILQGQPLSKKPDSDSRSGLVRTETTSKRGSERMVTVMSLCTDRKS